jgi:hypothetical protein
MKKIVLAFALLTFGFFAAYADFVAADMYEYPGGKFDGKDLYTYVGTTDLKLKVEWTPVADATGYELELYSVNRKVYVARASTPDPGLTFTVPNQGLYIVRVRAVRQLAAGADPVNSVWSTSDDPTVALVDGVPKGWWVYGFLAPPGPIQ